MGAGLDRRQKHTGDVLARIKDILGSPGNEGCASVESRYGGIATVYVTGSYGRGEASKHSDLDLFIVSSESSPPNDGQAKASNRRQTNRLLKGLDEICLKAALVGLTRALELPDFTGEGLYLECYTGAQLATAIGSDEDDYRNTFTARLLLLLESRPVVGQAVYDKAVDTVLKAYFRDHADHASSFEPTFLVNDILRLWRTFCVNYENRTSDADDIAKAKRKLKHFKLSHSRLLTCYSGIASLLDTFGKNGTVSPDDVRSIVRMTPTERIAKLAEDRRESRDQANRVLQAYEAFLDVTEADEPTLRQHFCEPGFASERMNEARAFAKSVYELIKSVEAGRLSQAVVV